MILGIDIGGTNLSFGIVNEQGTLLLHEKWATAQYTQLQDALVAMRNFISEQYPQAYAQLQSVGIGAPMLSEVTGVMDGAANIAWGQPLDVQAIAQEVFALTVFTENDANCALLGEVQWGQLKGKQNAVMVTLGTGIGGGLLLNGQIYTGAKGYAGEIGHTIYDYEGRPCKCGQTGCYERYIAAQGIVITCLSLIENFPQSPLFSLWQQGETLTPKIIASAAQNGDALAIAVYELTGKHLGRLLANITCNFNPEMIVLFGGIMHAGDLLLKPTMHYFGLNTLDIYREDTQIVVSQIHKQEMGVLGAAALGYQLNTRKNKA